MKLLLDANILLDVALEREHFDSANDVLVLCQDSIHQGFVSWHSLAVFYYICSRKKGDSDTREALDSLLDYVQVSPSDTAMAKMAIKSKMRDFEDALQAMAAIKSGCDFIVTRNIKDFKNSLVPPILPEKVKDQ